MKIDRSKLKKCATEVPADCKVLIDKLRSCSDDELLSVLEQTVSWTVGKCELYHWVDVLDRFDDILSSAASTGDTNWLLAINTNKRLQDLTLSVLHFTSLLIEYSFSRHSYSSVEHLISLLSSSSLDVILSVLNLLYVFSKRSNFLSRLAEKQRLPLLKRLAYLAESWGGKENGFGLAESCLNQPVSSFPANATTLHYEFYADPKDVTEANATRRIGNTNMFCIHVENVHQMSSNPAEIMESLIHMYPVPADSKMLLYTHLRLAHSFAEHQTRLKCVQARLHAISILVYMSSVSDVTNVLYSGFTEELVDLLQVKDNSLVDIKAAALRTLTSIVHLDSRDRTPRLGTIVDVTGVSQYHGFLPVLVRRCIDSMTNKKKLKEENPEFPHSFATALFSFLYHLSSYEGGGEALVQSGMMGPLLSVVTNMGDQQEQTTFVTRAVRVIDLITNIDWQAFQAVSGLQVFIDRLEHEVVICQRDAPPACDELPGSPASSNAEEDNMDVDNQKDTTTTTAMETEDSEKLKYEYKPGAQCLPQRAALFKSVLNFLKKAISDQAFGEQVRHMMDGTLPNSLKHIIGNVEYYGPALFLLAMEVVTVYVFQEPSLLSTLQDNRLTNVMLHALLVKNPPATREVLASLPNIFSVLCLNSRGLEAFVNCNPFDRLFHVMLSPDYLTAMRRRRSSDPLGDTASNLGNAMDELMRHQPTLRSATMKAIRGLLEELHAMGIDPTTVCTRSSSSKTNVTIGTTDSGPATAEAESQADESTAQDDAGSEDEVEEVPEAPSKQSASSTQGLTANGSKKHVPLLDYMQNVTKFIQAIVSNNTTDDHCREFRQHGGVPALLKLLRLPSLPLEFPNSPACQSVTNLTQTVFLLLREPTVLTESLAHVRDILQQLKPLFLSSDDGSKSGRLTSVLLHELIYKNDTGEKDDMPLVRSLVHIHAFVTLFLNMPRASQNEIRAIIVDEWGSKLGCEVLHGLNKLYRSLIWESTVLLALRTPGAIPEGCGISEKEIACLSAFEAGVPKQGEEVSSNQAMETDNGDNTKSSATKNKEANKGLSATAARHKFIKPVLTVASNLGRSLAELFGLLVKLAVGKPIRQRYNRHVVVPNAQNTAPRRPARALARLLSTLLKDGLSWRAPSDMPSSKLRITFLICTVGFTIPMLFDEKKMPYHLMLQYFLGTGAHDALFQCFKWALTSEFDSGKDASESSPNDLPGTVDDFLEAWLMLLERLVNPRNILNSPHTIQNRQPSASPDIPPAINAPFSAVKFLIKTQKTALEALQHLWSSGRLPNLSSRICDSVILILCHLIRGEQIVRDKLKEEKKGTEKKPKTEPAPQDPSALADYYFEALMNLPGSSTAARSSRPTTATSRPSEAPPARSTRQHDPAVVQQLMDMGFPRECCVEALNVTNTVEAATDWLLTRTSEENQLIRAITMSLENNSTTAQEQQSHEDAEVTNEETADDETGSASEIQTRESSDATAETDMPTTPKPSREEIEKRLEAEALQRADMEELKLLSQDDEEPMSSGDIDAFAASIFEGSLQLVIQMPDTVYRVCDVIVVLMKRAGKEWSDDVLQKLVLQIRERCKELTTLYNSDAAGCWTSDKEPTNGLATQALLFSLLFEEMKESCTRIVSETRLVATVVDLLHAVGSWLQKNQNKVKDSTTPKWISPLVLLTDLYERTRHALRCRNELKKRYSGHKREWKWFDDRSGRWCSYSSSNHKSIDDAYVAGMPSVRFTAGRRRYTINFNQLIQFNEESGNRRPVMATYQKDKGKAEQEKTLSKAPSEETMETDFTSSGKSERASPHQLVTEYTQLDSAKSDALVRGCTAFICLPVDADTLHSCMRLLLRLTRTGTEDGHKRAMLFAELGGAAALLRLQHHHGFIGFASLATLLLRHILEDDETLKITMEKTVRRISSSGAGNTSCGVNTGTFGSREMHYILRALAPAACKHQRLFKEACCDNMRVVLPPLPCRLAPDIEQEEETLVGPTGVQLIKASTRAEQVQPAADLPSVVIKTIRLLLDALVAVKVTKTDFKSDKEQHEGAEVLPILEGGTKPNAKVDQKATTSHGEDSLVTKSSILRLLAELVSSYPSYACLVANHQYKAGMTPLVEQDCSALSFILDHLLIPRRKPKKDVNGTVKSANTLQAASAPIANTAESTSSVDELEDKTTCDKDCPALARLLLACLAAPHPMNNVISDTHMALVSELKSSLSRAVHIPESVDKHIKLRSLLDMIHTIIESASKSTSLSRMSLKRQSQDSSSDQSSGNIPKLMIRRGLAADLAKIAHFIDLGSSEMAETVNAALKPLEILTRWTGLSTNAKQAPNEEKKSVADQSTSSVAESISQPQSIADIARGNANEEDWPNIAGMEDTASGRLGEETFDTNEDGDNVSQDSDLPYLDAPEEQPLLTQEDSFCQSDPAGRDVFMEPMGELESPSEDEVDVVVLGTRINSIPQDDDHDDDRDEDDVSQDDEEDIADDTINGDDSSDDSDQDDDHDDEDDQQDDEDELDGEGSEMDNQEEIDDDDIDGYGNDLNYDTFVYDLMQVDQQDTDLFIHLEDILGGMPGNRMQQQLIPLNNGNRRLGLPAVVRGEDNRPNIDDSRIVPPPPSAVATCHPLLVRHANHAQVTESTAAVTSTRGQGFGQSHLHGGHGSNAVTGARPSADSWGIRTFRGGIGSSTNTQRTGNQSEPPNQTIHVHWNSQPRTAPMVLQRLLGPAVAQDVLQISNTLYSEGGGRAQVVVNADDWTSGGTDDIIDRLFLDSMLPYRSGIMANTAGMVIPDYVPSSLARWVEESCVLDAQSLYDESELIKADIVEHILKIRDQDIKERREKREREKAEKQKEEEEKKKKEEQEKMEKAKREESSQASNAEVSVSVTSTEQVAADTPGISTPSNTPVATRPDSPSVTSTTERAPAINALQQASSSLLAVSGQLEGLSFGLQQARAQYGGEDAQTSNEATTQEADISSAAAVAESASEIAVAGENAPIIMDTTPPVLNNSAVNMETSEAQESEANGQAVGAANVESGSEPAEVSAPAAASERGESQVMEGVDPSFLAALPADIRQEVIREQLSRSQHRTPVSTSSSGSQQASGVSPEFLAALPPNIQEEVLEQERRERSRNTATNVEDDTLDATTFIQTLPAELRQSVLSDMDESLVAVLSEELVAEAQTLRGDAEERQRRILQERIFSRGTDLFRHPRIRHTAAEGNSSWGGFDEFSGGLRRRGGFYNGKQSQQASVAQTHATLARQILDHESLTCLLLLLFVEDGRVNTTWLHRVFRNLCHHSPTRDWLVATLMAILQRAGDVRPAAKPAGDSLAMDVSPAATAKMQKQFPKKITTTWPAEGSNLGNRNASWMSIRLEAALGSRSSIFQVEPPLQQHSPAQTSGRKSHQSAKDSTGGDVINRHVYIHPQAAPVVCRHVIDALIFLSRMYPGYFVASHTAKHAHTVKTQEAQVETDFWETLLRLDVTTYHKKRSSSRHVHPAEDDPSAAGKASVDPSKFDLCTTWLGVLMRMLCHPVVKRSQQLTDRMLRLLAQISRNISSASGPLSKSGQKTNDGRRPTSSTRTNTTDSNTPSDAPVQQNVESRSLDSDSVDDNSDSTTATMSARAGTSNTSTVGKSHLDSLTSTTASSRSHGSISTASETPAGLSRDEKESVMEKELSLAVGVLTSHACSEEGLEDATSLLLQLSKSTPTLRLLIIRLLLEGAQKLGGLLAQQIKMLLDEIVAYNVQQVDSGASPSTSNTPVKGLMRSRFDATLTVVLSAKDKFKKVGRELQLPSMQALTSKTSHQAFFLRILKVIIQLQQAAKGNAMSNMSNQNRPGNQFRWRGAGIMSAMRNTVSQLERDADALMEMIAPPSSRFRNQAERASQSSSSTAAAVAASSVQTDADSDVEKDETRFSERLQLDNLWEVLGSCLKELSKSHDQHAVLVLQPAVEAFFLVHATESSPSPQRSGRGSEPESRESQLAHLNEQPPVSPGQPAGGTSESNASLSSQSSLVDPSMPVDMQKFLRFAETHRTVLNQILRQSTVPLSEGPFAVLVDHTRVLDFDVKRRYFRQELERTEDSSVRRDDVAIRVRRDHLFEDSFRELHRRNAAELRSRLYVVFDGEDGQDAGGVLREWYLVISREIFNPMYALFRTSPGDHGTYAINPLSYINSNHLSYFKFVGRIVAKAIHDNKLLECYFTRSFYKHILGKPVKYTDMEAEDYEFSQGLHYLLEHNISSLGTELNFSVEIEEFGKTETRDLKENGRNMMVTEKNKREYVHLVCQEKMTGAIKKQIGAFLEGFYEIIPKRLISIFDEQELELLISGLPNIDIDDLRQNTEYHKYQANSLQIQWFWRALRSFDQAERAKFLQFVTGTSKVPLQGFASLEGMTGVQKFQIHRDDRSTSRLPCAHTCFNQLDLPAYETYDKLRERLLLAIVECTEGFGLA
ncbi:E3 ubiquitin-protein ligase HUWE1-like isoform X1 [Clavelina lepadiformis]|uniref:E3 ubiquitin-protein ligase HUWE1-like isoform X1 n=1 Tax=Clavelina lepadiformis TaxID=159417 RepID=UPI00404205C3